MSGLREGIHLDTNGVVVYAVDGIVGWMHPISFREMFGEELYQELLARPRVQSEYTPEELDE